MAMTKREFKNGLRILHSLDAHELHGLPKDKATAFLAEPARVTIQSDDETSQAIWDAMVRRGA